MTSILRKFHKLLFPLALFAGFALNARAQNTLAVSGDIKNVMAGSVPDARAKVCFSLTDLTGQAVAEPKIPGVGVLLQNKNVCVSPTNGHWSTTVYGNDVVQINGITNSTMYAVSYLVNNQPVFGANYILNAADGTADLNTKLPLGTPPAIVPPTADQIYARLNMTNGPFTATVTAPGFTSTGDYLASAANVFKWGSSGVTSPDSALSRCGVNCIQAGLTAGVGDASGTLKANQFVGVGNAGTASAFLANTLGTVTGLGWNATGNAVDNRSWDLITNGTQLQGRTVNDAQNVTNSWLVVSRSGVTPTLVDFSGATATKVAALQFSGTGTPTIQNDSGGAVQIGTAATSPSLTIGSNPFSAFSINPGTALVSNPTPGQARRGITYATDPAGDVTMWYNSSQTGSGYFFKNANGSVITFSVTPTGVFSGAAPASTAVGDVGAARTTNTGVYWLGSDNAMALFRNGATTFSLHTTTTDLFLPVVSDTLVARATTDTLTNKTIDAEGTGNTITIPIKVWLPAAGCNNATASTFWDLPTATPAAAACVTGTNTQKGVLDYADTAGGFSAQTTLLLPADFTGNIDARIIWFTPATTGNAKWSLSTICTAVTGSATDDSAFNAASTVTTAAPGTANQIQISSVPAVTITGCSAGNLLHVKLFRDGNDAADTITNTARFYGLELTIRRAM